jgi:hypothetical protein
MVFVGLSLEQLAVLQNCIGETLSAVDDFELHARTGADRAELNQLWETLERVSAADDAGSAP